MRIARAAGIVLVIVLAVCLFLKWRGGSDGSVSSGENVYEETASNDGSYAGSIPHDENFWQGAPDIDGQMLTPNSYSRPQLVLREINAIVIHYTADPGATAQNERDYFEGLADSGERHASSHFIVGLDGEIIQCIPCSEQAYASNSRNSDTLSIECCHPDETGRFTDATLKSAVRLTAWLCKAFHVSPDNVIRHYDITGKLCPLWFVNDEDAWNDFLADVKSRYDEIS